MATTPPDARRNDDVPTAPGPLEMRETYPLAITAQLVEDPGGRFRVSLLVGAIHAGGSTVEEMAVANVPGDHADREAALRAAARQIASKLN